MLCAQGGIHGEAVIQDRSGKKAFRRLRRACEYFNIDVVLVRIVWLVFALFYGAGILLYFVAALVLPNKSEIEVKTAVEYRGCFLNSFGVIPRGFINRYMRKHIRRMLAYAQGR